MKIKSALAVSVLALGMGLAMPAMAQQTSDNNSGPTTGAAGNNSDTNSTANSLDLNVQDSLNDNSDNSINDSGNLDVDDSGNTDNSINDSGNLDVDDSGNTDNSINDSGNLTVSDSGNDSSVDNSDNSSVVALQVLTATVANAEDMEFDGNNSNYDSGDNTVNGNAFAAYAGILNQAWNTGISANAQAATNVAARGTVTFTGN